MDLGATHEHGHERGDTQPGDSSTEMVPQPAGHANGLTNGHTNGRVADV
jgi:hypothetical protein